MLGEAAYTRDDARVTKAYDDALAPSPLTADLHPPYWGPSISVKLSALHPR